MTFILSDPFFVAASPMVPSFVVVRDGECFWVEQQNLAEAEFVDQSFARLNLRSEVSVDLRSYVDLVNQISSNFKQRNSVELHFVLRHLENSVTDETPLEGRLSPYEDDPQTSVDCLDSGILAVDASYSIKMPLKAIAAMEEHIASAGGTDKNTSRGSG